jgi:hypothetical protein
MTTTHPTKLDAQMAANEYGRAIGQNDPEHTITENADGTWTLTTPDAD